MPVPDFNSTYLQGQIARINRLVTRLSERDAPLLNGRVIPSAGDLPIGSARRLNATVLFLDISGFSSRGMDTEEEQWRTLNALTLFFSEMVAVIEDHGGVVEKNTGDGLMAYFIGGAADKPAQEKALRSALTMFAVADWYINPLLASWNTPPFQFRISMDHGWVSVAELGVARGFRSIAAIGTTANIAAKMLDHAQAGQILLGEQVLHGLPQAWIIRFAEFSTEDARWHIAGRPYRFFKYTGRWVMPPP